MAGNDINASKWSVQDLNNLDTNNSENRNKAAKIKAKDINAMNADSLKVLPLKFLRASEIKHIAPEQVAYLGAKQFNELADLNYDRGLFYRTFGKSVQSLVKSRIQAIDPKGIALIDPKVMADINANFIANLSSRQVNALTAEHIKTFVQPSDSKDPNSSAKINALDQIGIQSINTKVIKDLPIEVFNAMDPGKFAFMKSRQIYKIQPKVFAQIKESHLAELSSWQVGKLHSKQLNAIIEHWKNDPEEAKKRIQALDANGIARLGSGTIKNIKRVDFFNHMTSEQFAAIQPKAIGAIKDDIFAKLSPENIKALQPKQMAHLTARQLNALGNNKEEGKAKLTDLHKNYIDQIPPAVIKGLSNENFAKLTPLQLAFLSKEQVGALRGLQFDKLSAIQIQKLNKDGIAKISPREIAKISPEKLALFSDDQLKVLTSKQVAVLTVEQLKKLKPEQIALLNAEGIGKIPSKVLKELSEDQIKALTEKQVGALKSWHLNALAKENKIQHINPDYIKEIPTKTIKKLTADTLAAMTENQLEQLTTEQVGVLRGFQFEKLNKRRIQKLNTDGIAKISPREIAKISKDKLKLFSEDQLKALTAKQVAKLTVEQLKELGKLQIAALTNIQIGALKSWQLNALAEAAKIQDINEAYIKEIPLKTIKKLTGETLLAMTGDQLKNLTPEQVGVLKSKQLNKLAKEAEKLKRLSPEGIAKIKPSGLTTGTFAYLTADFFNNLSDAQIAKINPECISDISSKVIAKINVDVINKLKDPQVGKLTARQLKAMTNAQLKALEYKVDQIPPHVVGKLNAETLNNFISNTVPVAAKGGSNGERKAGTEKGSQIGMIDPKGISKISPKVISNLKEDFFNKLDPRQFVELTPKQVRAMTDQHWGKLEAFKLQFLTAEQIMAIDPAKIELLRDKYEKIKGSLNIEQSEAWAVKMRESENQVNSQTQKAMSINTAENYKNMNEQEIKKLNAINKKNFDTKTIQENNQKIAKLQRSNKEHDKTIARNKRDLENDTTIKQEDRAILAGDDYKKRTDLYLEMKRKAEKSTTESRKEFINKHRKDNKNCYFTDEEYKKAIDHTARTGKLIEPPTSWFKPFARTEEHRIDKTLNQNLRTEVRDCMGFPANEAQVKVAAEYIKEQPLDQHGNRDNRLVYDVADTVQGANLCTVNNNTVGEKLNTYKSNKSEMEKDKDLEGPWLRAASRFFISPRNALSNDTNASPKYTVAEITNAIQTLKSNGKLAIFITGSTIEKQIKQTKNEKLDVSFNKVRPPSEYEDPDPDPVTSRKNSMRL